MFDFKSRVLIFGAGKGGQRAWAALRAKKTIIGFIDNSSEMIGKTLFGLPVYAPEDVAKLKYDEIRISSISYGGEMLLQLTAGMGVRRSKIKGFRWHLLNYKFPEASWDIDAIMGRLPEKSPRVLLWGDFPEVQKALTYYQKMLTIAGLVTHSDEDQILEGYPLLSATEALKLTYDRIFVVSKDANKDLMELQRLGVAPEWNDVLDVSTLELPKELLEVRA